MIDNAAEQDLDDYADGVGLEPEPEDDDDLGEWADDPGSGLSEQSRPQSQPVVQPAPVTEAEVPMPMPAQVSNGKPKSKHNTGSRDSHVRAAKKGVKKGKQKSKQQKSSKSAKKPKKR
jgi:hypothetical protein